MSLGEILQAAVVQTLVDVLPVAVVIGFFQGVVLRERPVRLHKVAAGFVLLVIGLIMFRLGLALGLMPVGTTLPEQLVPAAAPAIGWTHFVPLHLFAFAVALAATLAEPSLIAIAERVGRLTGGALRPLHLRLVVAFGAGIGLVLGTLRIVLDVPLAGSAAVLVVFLVLLTRASPPRIRGLAFDLPPTTLAHLSRTILETVARVGRFDDEPGSGIALQLSIEDAVGLGTQIEALSKRIGGEL